MNIYEIYTYQMPKVEGVKNNHSIRIQYKEKTAMIANWMSVCLSISAAAQLFGNAFVLHTLIKHGIFFQINLKPRPLPIEWNGK